MWAGSYFDKCWLMKRSKHQKCSYETTCPIQSINSWFVVLAIHVCYFLHDIKEFWIVDNFTICISVNLIDSSSKTNMNYLSCYLCHKMENIFYLNSKVVDIFSVSFIAYLIPWAKFTNNFSAFECLFYVVSMRAVVLECWSLESQPR